MRVRFEGGTREKGIEKRSLPGQPLVSIVTVVYNGKKNLEQAILSVLNQTYNNIEYIIIDGLSDDGTIDILKKYDDRIDQWISEKDGGIYEAMNKGIGLCNGLVVGLLNSDDFYFPGIIDDLVANMNKYNSGIWYGNLLRLEEYTEFYNFRILKPDLDKMYERPSIYHPACFVHMDVYKTIGLFDLRYKIISDYDFLLRAIEQGVLFIYFDKVFTGFRSGGISGSAKAWVESYRLIKEHPKHKAGWFYITRNLIRKMLVLRFLRIRKAQQFINRKRKLES